MIVTNKQTLISGNTVLVPNENPSRSFEKENKQDNKKSVKNNKHRKLKEELKVLMNISLAFIIGLTIIYRYSALYVSQKNLNDIRNEISSKKKENEDLRINLIKFQSDQYIENEALGKLHMVKPDKNSIEYIDLSKNNFKTQKEFKEEQNKSNLLAKIKNFFS